MAGLTPKQEAFCQAYIETGNASEAYRTAYAADRMKPEAVHVQASKLQDNPKIALRLKELQGEIKHRCLKCLDCHVIDLAVVLPCLE